MRATQWTRVVTILGAMVLGTWGAGAAGAATAEKITLKFGHAQSVSSPIHLAAVRFADLVAQRTNGRVEVRIYPNSQLGNAGDELKGVEMGSQDLFVDGPGFLASIEKDWTFMSVGFFLPDMTAVKKIMASDIGTELKETLRTKRNMRVIADNWYRSGRQLFSKKPVASLADLSGLKIRVPNKTFFETWRQLGAAPSIVDFGETFGALQQGVVDAMEGAIADVYAQKMHQVARRLILLNYLPQTLPLVFSERRFVNLPPDIQKAILDAAQEAGNHMAKLEEDLAKQDIEEMKKEGITVSTVNLDEWYAKAKPLPAQYEAEGRWKKGLFDRLQAVMK